LYQTSQIDTGEKVWQNDRQCLYYKLLIGNKGENQICLPYLSPSSIIWYRLHRWDVNRHTAWYICGLAM